MSRLGNGWQDGEQGNYQGWGVVWRCIRLGFSQLAKGVEYLLPTVFGKEADWDRQTMPDTLCLILAHNLLDLLLRP